MVTEALLVRLEALPGKEQELQLGLSAFGVYDVFPDDEARDAHLTGGVGQALGPDIGVLFSEPVIEKIDILADKVPA
jgi:hypothetical protein